MIGAHLDSWHGGHRRHRQRGRRGHGDGGRADPPGPRPEAAAHHPHRPLERRGAGPARRPRLRHRALRRRAPGPRPEERRRALVPAPRHAARSPSSRSTRSCPRTSTSTTARARSAASTPQKNVAVAPIFEAWLAPVRRPRRDDGHAAHHPQHRPRGLRRRSDCPASSSSRTRPTTRRARTTRTWTSSTALQKRRPHAGVGGAGHVRVAGGQPRRELPRKPLPKDAPAPAPSPAAPRATPAASAPARTR